MSDTVFRAKAQPQAAPETPKAPEDKGVPRGVTEVEPPYTDYKKERGKPFIVDHYELGDMWNRFDKYADMYVPEVDTIEQYMEHMIDKGEVNNTLDSVREEIKRIEKLVNVKKDSRASMRMELVSEYMNFLLKSEGIRRRSGRFRLR